MSSREKQARWIGSSPSSAVPATFPWLFASKLHRKLPCKSCDESGDTDDQGNPLCKKCRLSIPEATEMQRNLAKKELLTRQYQRQMAANQVDSATLVTPSAPQ
ncbi:hypothetical protein PIIN_04494 [Serendipita indica DSM 11827]|uniref:Uncharacterized protein n=1 Tax=Serendipita indica (strain DSM 11827) TaxID=1109443 RepID=G4TGV5_SERID|nr:hypothetical protein PIIN_04494 [Serendipita indica DSM 11827]